MRNILSFDNRMRLRRTCAITGLRTYQLRALAVWAALALVPAADWVGLTVIAQESADSAVASVERLVAALDSPDYFAREHAMRQLRTRATEGSDAAQVAAQLKRLSFDSNVSYEAQLRLAEILTDIPAANLGEARLITDSEAADLIASLIGDRFSQRQSAIRRIEWLLSNDQNIVPLLVALKAKLADTKLTPSVRQLLEKQHDLARGAWLMAPPERCVLSPVAEGEIERLLAVVTTPPTDDAGFAASGAAVRELEDLLAREEYRAVLTERLAAALEHTAEISVRNLLTELVDLTRPSMVAEIWTSLRYTTFAGGMAEIMFDPESLRLGTIQYLHVGVPQIPEGATRATHFDRCDDKVAHCVSGNTLTPGDYPVGTAFVHASSESTLFHLVHLPTPRRRLLYEHLAARDESIRFRELSQRTCDAFLSGERKLTKADVTVLLLLDRAVVNRFACEFLRRVPDAALAGAHGSRLTRDTDDLQADSRRQSLIALPSQHGVICYVLARRGDKTSAESVLAAIADKRVLSVKEHLVHDLPHIALLSIAQRSPWPDADNWLAQQTGQVRPIVANTDKSSDAGSPALVLDRSYPSIVTSTNKSDVGATAAAILARRVGVPVESLGLIEQREELCLSLGLLTYQFESAEAREEASRKLKSLLTLRQETGNSTAK